MRNKKSFKKQAFFLSLSSFLILAAAPPAGYLNPNLTAEQRAHDLVSKMTLTEKVSQMINEAPAIERLGVPKYNWWSEALHGVAASGVATVFPQAIGMSATWDTDLMFDIATVISDEGRAKHHQAVREGKRDIFRGLTFWSPNINIFRDPRWGRGQETYGEDPYLTARFAVPFIKGLQGNDPHYLKTVATPKHYAVHSGPDPERHHFDAQVGERDLRDTYLPAFEASIREGHAYSVMGAYNRINGEPACSNTRFLDQILRKEWGFQGYIVSDCGAIGDIFWQHHVVGSLEEASARSVRAGTDLDCGTEYLKLGNAVKLGLIAESEINQAVERLFAARFKLGMFDAPESVSYAQIPYSVVDSDKHRQLALRTARESIVLLKNAGQILPLKKNLKKIAVIGPNADELKVLLGNYSGTPSHYVTPLQGIRKLVSPGTEVLFSRGSELEGMPFETVSSEFLTGLKGEYYNNRGLSGQPALVRNDRQIDFFWQGVGPDQRIQAENFSVRWTGKLLPKQSGQYIMGATTDDGFRLYLDGKLILDNWTEHPPERRTLSLGLEAGRSYDFKMEYFQAIGNASARLEWSTPDANERLARGPREEAIKMAKGADVVIMALGLSTDLESEELDRRQIELPLVQQELLEAVHATGTPTVLLLMSGSAVAMPWAKDKVDAILEAWYPGEEGGTAVAEVLFGDVNPSGRLPVTFYSATKDMPAFDDYRMAGRTYRYFKGKPLYPFGFGLSYSTFQYSGLTLSQKKISANQPIQIAVEVQNTGARDGDEVAEFYLSGPSASGSGPIRSLVGFKRVSLKAGEKARVEVTIEPKQISTVQEDGRRVVEPGLYLISAGGGQPLDGDSGALTGAFEVAGKAAEIR